MLGLAGLSLLVAEGVCRFGLGLGTPPLYQADPELEYRFRPNQELRRFGHRIAINQYGLRGTPLTPTPAPGVARLLVFGDSVVWGGAQLDQRQIAISLLPALVRSAKPLEVAAVATPSWGPANWLAFVRRYQLLGAQRVLLVISSHDAIDWPSFEPLDAQPDKPTRTPLLALEEALFRYAMPLFRRPGTGRGARMALPEVELEKRGLAALDALIVRIRREGGSLRVLQYWDRNETLTGQPKPGHEAIAALLDQHAVETLQSGPLMAACARHQGSMPSALFVDEIHPYTVLGQQCLAAAMVKSLTQ